MTSRKLLLESERPAGLVKPSKSHHRRVESAVQMQGLPLTYKYLSSYHTSQPATPNWHSSKPRLPTHSSLNNTCISLPTGPDSPVTTKASSRSFARTLSNLTEMMEETTGKAGEEVGYKRAISLLDAEVKRLKQESQSKSQEIESLTARLRSPAGQIPNSSAEMAVKRRFERPSAASTGLRRELDEANRRTAAAEQEIQRLKAQNSSTELHFQAAQAQIAALSQRISDRDSASNPLYAVLACFQRENKTLKEEIHRLQGELLSQESYYVLERELKDMEARQSLLEEENKTLRRRTEEGEERRGREERRLGEIGGCVSDRKREVGQLTEIVRIITQGESLSASLLLGSRLPPAPPVPDAPIDYLAQEALLLQKEIAALRQVLADVYAEQSGLLCSPQ